jgi:hypothetical protein
MNPEPSDDEVSQAVDQFLDSVKECYIGGANLITEDWLHGYIGEDPKTGKSYLIVRVKAPDDFETDDGTVPEVTFAFEEEAALKLLRMVDYLGDRLWGTDDDDDE